MNRTQLYDSFKDSLKNKYLVKWQFYPLANILNQPGLQILTAHFVNDVCIRPSCWNAPALLIVIAF